MVWLIGSKGLLGSDVFNVLTANKIPFFFSDSELDICNKDLLLSATKNEKIDWIVNCAGYTDISDAEKNKEKAIDTNCHSLANIIEVAKIHNAKIIHISAEDVFDGNKFEGYTEEDTPAPLNNYGLSKLLGDQYLMNNYDKFLILRTSWLYGKYGINFVHTMLKMYGSGSTVSIVDDQTGSPTYTSDIAKVIGYLISINTDKYGLYNCSNTGQTDWFEFAKVILEKSIYYNILPKWIKQKTKIVPITSKDYSAPVPRPRNSYLLCDKLGREFSIHMRQWDAALDDFFKSIQKKANNG